MAKTKERMQFRCVKHPSGRPLHDERSTGRPIWRIPDNESNVPRLRVKSGVPAIGFIHRFPFDNLDEE